MTADQAPAATDPRPFTPFTTFIKSPRAGRCGVAVAADDTVTVTRADGASVHAGTLYRRTVAVRGMPRAGVEAVAPNGHWLLRGGRTAPAVAARELAHLAVSHPLYTADFNPPA